MQALKGAEGPIIAATDYMKVVPDQLAPWLPGRLESLGTDGFGRSDNREHLRRHFEINAESIAAAALSRLARDGKFDAKKAAAAFAELGVDTEKADPGAARRSCTPGSASRVTGMVVSGALAVVKIFAGLARPLDCGGRRRPGIGQRRLRLRVRAARPDAGRQARRRRTPLRPRPRRDPHRPPDRSGLTRRRRR